MKKTSLPLGFRIIENVEIKEGSHISVNLSTLRFLVYGAGAIGTYIGGSLAIAGEDVIFLDREDVAAQLMKSGLTLGLPAGEKKVLHPAVFSSLEQTLNLEDHRSPVNNLKAGIYYYAMLVGRYNDCGDTNKYRFALAAYNAGSGHVEDAMSIAYYFKQNYLDWNYVKEDMKLLAPANDSLQRAICGSRPPNGTFANWKEPYNYVENIIYFWDQYKKIYPLPEDNPKGQKKKKKKK